MDKHQLEKRKVIMKRSIALGHCVCDPKKPCPCLDFKEKDVCQCAGEKMPLEIDGDIKLTDYVKSAGCASKIGKKDLVDILSGVPAIEDDRVLVGSNAGDDAGVILLSEDDTHAHILTVDVFAPSVDDPYTFGEIAAANSVSDVYAMGGKPQAALSIIGFPVDLLPNDVMTEILKGGIEKMKEAGVPVVGGHSIKDGEIKCGFAVLGTCPKDGFVRNSGAQIGDVMILTKPLGVGITAFAGQIGHASADDLAEIAKSMSTLNKDAAEVMQNNNVNAATDITGYSLLGHLSEIVKNSKVEVEIIFEEIPLFNNVANLARREILPGAVERNRESVSVDILNLNALADAQTDILFSPETSGGLLMFIPEINAEKALKELQDRGISSASIIGKVTSQNESGLITVTTECKECYSHVKVEKLKVEKQSEVQAKICSDEEESDDCCCCCPDESSESTPSCCS